MPDFKAVYECMNAEDSLGSVRTFEAHAKTWREAALSKLPRYLYPAGRRYRRISGPFTTSKAIKT